MIKKVPYHQIDFKKYSNCIANACNANIYAELWYLESLVSEQWFCYVLNDYEAVMPVCYAQKWGIKYIIQPTFCQQLGVFYASPISEEIFALFVKKLRKNIVKSYAFNHHNTQHYAIKGKTRNNYTLDLNPPYEELYSQFNQNTKRNLKKQETAQNLKHIKEEIINLESLNSYLHFKKENAPHLLPKTFIRLTQLLHHKNIKPNLHLLSYNFEGITFAKMIFIKNQNTLYYLNGVSNLELKKEANTLLLMNYFIKKQASKNITLDLEGSDNKGIAQFFKGLGASNKIYIQISNVWK